MVCSWWSTHEPPPVLSLPRGASLKKRKEKSKSTEPSGTKTKRKNYPQPLDESLRKANLFYEYTEYLLRSLDNLHSNEEGT